MWDIVGGFLEAYEHPEDGLRREVLEETGLEVEVIEYFDTTIGDYEYQNEINPTLNIIYRTRVTNGEIKAGDDIESLEWFHKNEVPSKMAFDGQMEVINKWVKLKS